MQTTTTKPTSEFEALLAQHPIIIPKIGDQVEGKVLSVSKREVHLDIAGYTSGVIRGEELFDESGEYSDLKVGDTAVATVIDLENEEGEMELSFKYTGHQKAWERLEGLFSTGEVVPVKVTSCNKGGLMVKLGKISGFLPVSQLSVEHYPRVEGGDKNKILEKINKLVNKNLQVKVIDVDESEEKLIVSERASHEEAQQEALEKYKVGDVVEGKVTGVVDFGAFVEFDDGLEGLVHISELAWQRIDDPRNVVNVGETIKAEIISIEKGKISLSIKKLNRDPWIDVDKKYKIGDIVEGTVLKLNPYGLFVELDQDIHGLAHISELSSKPVQSPAEIAQPGDVLKFKVMTIEPEHHRLGLSLKAVTEPDAPSTPEPTSEEKPSEEPAPEAPDQPEASEEEASA